MLYGKINLERKFQIKAWRIWNTSINLCSALNSEARDNQILVFQPLSLSFKFPYPGFMITNQPLIKN